MQSCRLCARCRWFRRAAACTVIAKSTEISIWPLPQHMLSMCCTKPHRFRKVLHEIARIEQVLWNSLVLRHVLPNRCLACLLAGTLLASRRTSAACTSAGMSTTPMPRLNSGAFDTYASVGGIVCCVLAPCRHVATSRGGSQKVTMQKRIDVVSLFVRIQLCGLCRKLPVQTHRAKDRLPKWQWFPKGDWLFGLASQSLSIALPTGPPS
jgi:hypothetical protein